MPYKETEPKSVRMEVDLVRKIEELREGTERTFSQQVVWMLKQYIAIIEQSKK